MKLCITHSKSMKMEFVARIIRHELCMVYAFFDFFCSKIIFNQKSFPNSCDKVDYLWSIVLFVLLSEINLRNPTKAKLHTMNLHEPWQKETLDQTPNAL